MIKLFESTKTHTSVLYFRSFKNTNRFLFEPGYIKHDCSENDRSFFNPVRFLLKQIH